MLLIQLWQWMTAILVPDIHATMTVMAAAAMMPARLAHMSRLHSRLPRLSHPEITGLF
jgi:hypothetical protein